jgi:ABC-2 type transport system permease protein
MIAILRKELRTRMRGWRTPTIIMLYLAALSIVAYIALDGSLGTDSFSANQATTVGLNLFNTLALLEGVLIVFITPAATSAAISGERQRQTLDLLLVTRLSSFGIAAGKLVAAVAFDMLLLVCALPVFSLAFLFGGIGLVTVFELGLLLSLSIFCFGSIGLLVSTVTRRSQASTVITYVSVILLVGGLGFASLYLYAAGYVGTVGSTATPLTAYFDPALGLAALLYSQDPSFLIQLPFSVWQVSLLTCGIISILCIALSTLMMRRQSA